jgi:5-methylthioadenosine/S-adenosylhomocysteine deaminase
MDEAALRAEARAHASAFATNKGAIDEAARDLLPFYRAMYLKAAAQDVGMNRWVAGIDKMAG